MNQGDRLQWSRGEYYSQLETVKELDEENEILRFESGRICKTSVLLEYMIPLEKGVAYIIEPQNNSNNNTQLFPVQSNILVPPINNNVESILNIFKRSADKSENTIILNIEFNKLPTSDVINMMYNIYEEDEVADAILLYLKMDVDKVLEQIKENLKNYGKK